MWCWSKRWTLESNRLKTLSIITGERSLFETMMQRAQVSGMAIPDFAAVALSRLTTYESQAKVAATKTELDDISEDAQQQGQ